MKRLDCGAVVSDHSLPILELEISREMNYSDVPGPLKY